MMSYRDFVNHFLTDAKASCVCCNVYMAFHHRDENRDGGTKNNTKVGREMRVEVRTLCRILL